MEEDKEEKKDEEVNNCKQIKTFYNFNTRL